MSKPIEIQYVYKNQIGFTKKQKDSLEKLSLYGVNVNDFIRTAIKEKIQRDWKEIKESKNKYKCPF